MPSRIKCSLIAVNHLALFAPKNFNLSSSPKLLIDNSEISFVQSVKYLGLHINSILLMTLTFTGKLNQSIAQRIN